MSDVDEEGGGPVSHKLTEEEKAAARARKAAKRAAKAAALSQEAIAEAEARRARIAEREEVRCTLIYLPRAVGLTIHRNCLVSTELTAASKLRILLDYSQHHHDGTQSWPIPF